MGSRMSGQPSWQMHEESAVSTPEWMIDCGWMTTLMSS